MAPKMTLTYFDIDALAEPVRLCLTMTGQTWEDKRVSFDQFALIKPTLPYGQLPILEFNGKVLPQAGAQLRFVGKFAGLYPHDPVEAAFADAAVDSVSDMHLKLLPTIAEKDMAKKLEMRKDMVNDFLPKWLANLEKSLELAGGDYFAGGRLSIGDIAVVARILWMKEGTPSLDGIPSTLINDYRLLSALVDRVCAEPKIAAYHKAKLVAKKD